MGRQRVTRSQTITHTTASEFRADQAVEAGDSPDPTDFEALNALDAQLSAMVNDSPPLYRPWDGDQAVLAVARVWCGPCRRAAGRGRGMPVAKADALDARHRGGPIIFVLKTQYPGQLPSDPWPQTSVVLGAPGDALGRTETPCPDTALTWCRAHGRLTVKIDVLLYEARRALQDEIAGKRRQGSVTAWPG